MKIGYAFLALVLTVSYARADDEFVKQVVEPAVMIQVPFMGHHRSIGAGSVIKRKDKVYVLTCAHVVEGFRTKVVRQEGEETVEVTRWARVPFLSERAEKQKRYTGKVVLFDGKADLALIEAEKPDGLATAKLADADVRLKAGEECAWSGAAFFDWNSQKGMINRVTPKHYLVNAGVWFGHSGSGLYVRRDKTWQLAGVVFAVYTAPKGPGLVVRREAIETFLEGLDGD